MRQIKETPEVDGAFEDIGAFSKFLSDDGWPLMARLTEKGADEYLGEKQHQHLFQLKDEVRRIAILLASRVV